MSSPQKNVAFIFDIALVDTSNQPAFKANPTLASGDFKVSIDNGTLTNLGTLPVVSPVSGRIVKVVMSQTEMNGDRITIVGVDATGDEWDDVVISINTTVDTIDTVKTDTAAILVDTGTTLDTKINTIDDFLDTEIAAITAAVITNATGADIAADIIAVKAETVLIVADTNELQGDDVPSLISTLDAVVDTVKVDTAAILVDTNELQGDDVPGLIATLDTLVDTVKAETALIVADTSELQGDWANGGRLDLLIDAIKVPTDKMVFTKANELDSNTKSINDAEVVGDGNATPWDGA